MTNFAPAIPEPSGSPFITPADLGETPFVVLRVRANIETEFGRKIHFSIAALGLGERTLSMDATPRRETHAEAIRAALVSSPACGPFRLRRSEWTDDATGEVRSAWHLDPAELGDVSLSLDDFRRVTF